MTRKTLRERIREAQDRYIQAVLAFEANVDPVDRGKGTYRVYDAELKAALRGLHLRERDVIYHARDAYARLEGALRRQGQERQ